MKNINRAYFRHFVIETEIKEENLNSEKWLRKNIENLLSKLKIPHIKSVEHHFNPEGISLVYILSSSHIAVHTWPKNNYLHIDLVTCSRNKEIENITEVAKSMFVEEKTVVHEFDYYEKGR